MSDFGGFNDLFLSPLTSRGGSGYLNSASPAGDAKYAIPTINIKNEPGSSQANELLSKSLDIKKQLSQSFQNTGLGPSGGISKPQSRKNSIVPIRSNHASDNEDNDDDDEGQGNERKRRDNINDKIQELLTLIPAELFAETAPTNSPGENQSENDAAIAAAMKNSGTKDGKPNKGQILTKSVEYLQYLQNLIDENNRKEVELVMTLKTLQYKEQGRAANLPINVGHTSAEHALGKIGVGPLSDDYFKLVLVKSAGINKLGQRRDL